MKLWASKLRHSLHCESASPKLR